MIINKALLKGVKADFIKGEVTITFTLALDEDILAQREELALLEEQTLDIELITQPQVSFKE